jgi:hypothetical protein
VEQNKRNLEILLRRHPPVFAHWFVHNFPDPQVRFRVSSSPS